jgi:hypothetical protein
MPKGIPRTEAERTERHFSIFGTAPPVDRQNLGPVMESFSDTLWAWLPDLPLSNGGFNLPLPRWLNAKIFGAGRRLP